VLIFVFLFPVSASFAHRNRPDSVRFTDRFNLFFLVSLTRLFKMIVMLLGIDCVVMAFAYLIYLAGLIGLPGPVFICLLRFL
jgi:hypothetical protein